MKEALSQARQAAKKMEVPIGAVIVKQGKIISRAHNLRESKKSSLAHAEILAINKACRVLKSWRLNDCAIYVTLEPCTMCAGAILEARMGRVIFGAMDPKAGAVGSTMDVLRNHPMIKPQVTSGFKATECRRLLKSFFKKLRRNKSK